MKPIVKEKDVIIFVDESDMLKFISNNSDYEWNDLCDITREEGLFSDDGTYRQYDLDSIDDDCYTEFTKTWVTNFFNSHPFIKRVAFVFDS